MIDLHCHILPDVDDGAKNTDVALSMAKMAWTRGTTVIAATSHFNRPDQPRDLETAALLNALIQLRRQLEQEKCPLRITQGMELFASPELPDILNQGRVLTLNGSRYLLTEFFFDERLSFMDWCFDEITNHGYVPVVAHPERYEAVQRRPGAIGDWFSRGYIIQLNKGSVLGQLGDRAEDTAWWALERGLAHVVASDAHSDEFRTPGLDRLKKYLSDELNEAYADLLLDGNPRRILRNQLPAQSF